MNISVLAVDLGATSGRVMIGRVGPDTLELEPVARFANGPVETNGELHWDFAALYEHVVAGLREGLRREPGARSLGIDSWAVDYGLIVDGQRRGEPFHYRDVRGESGVEIVHGLVPFAELYARNGLQFLPFNTLYQFAVERHLGEADAALLIPDLIAYLLTGAKVAERTNASTTGLLSPHTGQWDEELIARLGVPRHVLPALVSPGEIIGRARIEENAIDVVAVGSHDTASAVAAVPMDPDTAAYVSCGTWGLVGVETRNAVLSDDARAANFTNEGGLDGRTRFLHNVMGLWVLSEAVRGWEAVDDAPISLPELLAEAEDAEGVVFNIEDPSLLPPGDMAARIDRVCIDAGTVPPRSRAEYVRSIIESLAEAFATSVDAAARLSGVDVQTIHLVGGGALNELLCQRTADRSGLPVVAGPVEATALGNVLAQARAAGVIEASLEAMRALVARTQSVTRYTPVG